jgi:hypothetical protein
MPFSVLYGCKNKAIQPFPTKCSAQEAASSLVNRQNAGCGHRCLVLQHLQIAPFEAFQRFVLRAQSTVRQGPCDFGVSARKPVLGLVGTVNLPGESLAFERLLVGEDFGLSSRKPVLSLVHVDKNPAS